MMEKTEMMERFEEETGKHSVILKFMAGGQASEQKSYPKLGPYDYSMDYIAWLEAKANIADEAIEAFLELIRNQCDEISALKEQLRWRPVSEKPKERQFVFGYNQKTKYFDVVLFYNDEFYLRGIAVTITHWFPIPTIPAPEGE
jgi:hypothetical protein